MYEVPPIDVPNGFNIDNAARIRKETGMLTVGVGKDQYGRRWQKRSYLRTK